MPNGYNGKILHVNLTSGKFTIEEPSGASFGVRCGVVSTASPYSLTIRLIFDTV